MAGMSPSGALLFFITLNFSIVMILSLPKVYLHKTEHRGIARLALQFPYDKDLIQKVRSLGTRWSQRGPEGSLDGEPELYKEGGQPAAPRQNTLPPMLWQSFATHLMDHSTDARHIPLFLGHSKLATTALYTLISQADLQKVISPLDRFGDIKT